VPLGQVDRFIQRAFGDLAAVDRHQYPLVHMLSPSTSEIDDSRPLPAVNGSSQESPDSPGRIVMRTGGAVIDLHQNRIKEPMLLIYSIFLMFQLLRPRFSFLAEMFFGCMVQDVDRLILCKSR
jgi:hypothetical protein